jgi:hypothetical protein
MRESWLVLTLTPGLIFRVDLCLTIDLSSAPFEMRPCMREKLRKRNIYWPLSAVQVTCWGKTRLASSFQPPLLRSLGLSAESKSLMSEAWALIPIVWQSFLKTFVILVIFEPVTSVAPWKHLATRKRTHASITNLCSQKRRRSSVASFDFGRDRYRWYIECKREPQ